MVKGGLTRKLLGHRRWRGTPVEVCEQIVRSLWDPGRGIFRTSLTSYPEFWARDFGRAATALLALGFTREVGMSYAYALDRYERAGGFALVITPAGRLLDFPPECYAPDGFAFFLDGLAALDDRSLVRRHRSFLEREARRFHDIVVDPRTGLARRRTHFSEAQDYAVRDGSCYSSVMCHVAERALAALGLAAPLSQYDFRETVLAAYFRDGYFRDDARLMPYVSGDASVAPFRSGLLEESGAERRLFDGVLARMDAAGLNTPFPSRYGASSAPHTDTIFIERFNPWQRNAVWPCLGLDLAAAMKRLGHPRFCATLSAIAGLVERLACFPEVIDPRTLNLFRGPLYMSEDSMIWAASLWHLLASPD